MSAASLSSNFLHVHNNSLSDINCTRQWSSNSLLECRVSYCPQPKSKARLRIRVMNFRHVRRDSKADFIVAKSYNPESSAIVYDEIKVLDDSISPSPDDGGSDDGNGKFPPENGGNGDNGGGGEGDDEEGKEFGAIMKFEDVMRETEKHGAILPSDILEAAKSIGIRELILKRYLELQGTVGPLGFLMRHCGMLRNRMLADPAFLFKIGTEIVIDSCCATFAEVQKRGKDFWAEFELYLADLLVGVVVNVALVGMLAPYVRIGNRSTSAGFLGGINRACRDLPSSVFEAERPGCRFTGKQRVASYLYTGVMQGAVGFGCGIFGQGIANLIMTAKRNIRKSDEDIPVPPLLESAALWGAFLAFSSNTRYQIINGLERVVETSPLAKNFPPVALAFTVGVRFANNVYGGMQFVDWARWSGVQ